MARDPRESPVASTQAAGRDRACEARRSSPTVPTEGLALPRTEAREPVRGRMRTYQLRDTETQTLATVGAFRVVPATDLAEGHAPREVWRGDLRHLEDQGLIDRTTVVINHRATPVAVLTEEGKALLDGYQHPGPDGRAQQYHAGLVKPRELAHDAQLYRLFQAEAARIEADGGRVTRVVLDAELKGDYQRVLQRRDRPEGTSLASDRRAFAETHGLSVVDGHLALPDLRIEYETDEGRRTHRDLELVTEHYSRSQLAGKARAGFTQYRAAGSGGWHGGSTTTGGTPFDPHYLERLT